jgi:DNA-binding MarR family transcriptional regulator
MERVQRMMNLLRLLDREVPAQVLATFFYVAAHDNCHKQAVEEELNLTTAAGSRCTDKLTDQSWVNKPGLDLIIKEQDPSNKRRQQLRLTPKGKALIQQIEEILYGDQAPELSGQETSQGNDQEL